MATANWWADDIQESLSQGDIVKDLPLFLTNPVTRYLKKNTFRGGLEGWLECPNPVLDGASKTHFLVPGCFNPIIILSHSCELDKNKGRVIVAPIVPIDREPPEQQETILNQGQFALMPLPSVPGLGATYYADFRSMTTVHRDIVDKGTRIASMTNEANLRTGTQLMAFFLRLEVPGRTP